MPKPLTLPPGHRIVITIDADRSPMGVLIAAYRGTECLGEFSVNAIDDLDQLQLVVDRLTRRGPRLFEIG